MDKPQDKRPQDKRLEEKEPAKGGIESPKSKPYPSGDSPKPHGDPLRDDLKQAKSS